MPEEMRPQVGMNVNVPIRLARRSAAVREAAQRVQQRRAEYQERLDQVRFEVQAAFDRAVQSATGGASLHREDPSDRRAQPEIGTGQLHVAESSISSG